MFDRDTSYYDDRIESQLLDRRSVKAARKDHKCDLCGYIIPVGSCYVRETALVDGEFYVQKRHYSCGSEEGGL